MSSNKSAKMSSVVERLTAMIELVPDGIAICDVSKSEELYIEVYNEHFKSIFGIDEELAKKFKTGEFTLEAFAKLVHDDDREELLSSLRKSIRDLTTTNCEFRVNLKGLIKWIRMSMTSEYNDGNIVRCHCLFSDISADREREAQVSAAFAELKYITCHDQLTQLYNRDAFCERTESLLRNNPDTNYTLAMCDIKNFKVVNDLFGNETGDKVLIHMSKRVRDIAKENGTYGRLNSDKFAFCIPSSEFNADEILIDMDNWLNNSGIIDYNVKVFLGIYDIFDEPDLPISNICDRAALALKNAKRDYVKRYTHYDNNMRQSIMDEEFVLNEMEDALKGGQFKLCYQPIFSISTGKPVSAEALVRWVHPTRGIIPPNKFIPVFENNKFITYLDKYVFEEVCKFQRARIDSGKEPIPISVNFSRLDCYLPMICEDVYALVEKYGLTTDMIKIEITESAYSEDKEQIICVAEKLRGYGFSILMDDFGSGYSSLNILKDVKVDILKIDKKFVDDMADSDMGGAIISCVVRMARLIGIDVIAEGVEEQYQIDFLRGIGCDTIQGYYYSKPLFEDNFTKLLDEHQNMPLDMSRIKLRKDSANLDSFNADINSVFGGLIGALGLYELGPDGVLEIIRVNDAYYDLFGSSPSKVYSDLAKSFSQLTEDSRHALLKACSKAKYDNEIASAELRKFHEDGHPMWISCRIKYIGRDDNRDMFYILINDITERKRQHVSQQLNEYAEVFKTFFNAIFEFNPTKKVVKVIYSDGSLSFDSGAKFETMDFRKTFIERAIPDGNIEKFRETKAKFDKTDKCVDRWNLRNNDGEIRPFERRLIKISNSDDDIYLSCFVDMTKNMI